MNLIDKKVEHKQFGTGVISHQSEDKITVQFDAGEKKFIYPMAFDQFLILEDAVLGAEIATTIQSMKTEIENEKKAKANDALTENIKVNKSSSTTKAKKGKTLNKIAKVIERENDENIIIYLEK